MLKPKLMLTMIEIESVDIWPKEVVNILENNFDILKKYILREHGLMSLLSTERWNKINKYASERALIIEDIKQLISKHKVTVYHCTRLTESEIDDVNSNGIQPLSLELINNRITKALSENLLSKELADYLLSANQCNDKNRSGMLWFAGGVSTLKDEGAVVRLFQSWGGEALYNSHEDDTKSGHVLKAIGKPCIIKASLFPTEFKAIWVDLGERLVNAFLIHRGIKNVESPNFDTYIDFLLRPERFVLIQRENPLFESLTNCNRWREKI